MGELIFELLIRPVLELIFEGIIRGTASMIKRSWWVITGQSEKILREKRVYSARRSARRDKVANGRIRYAEERAKLRK